MIRYLSPDARQFNGRVYRRNPSSRWSSDRRYFKPTLAEMKAGVRPLHVEVWRFHRGEVPSGFHVHHRGQQTTRNRLRDLTLMAVGAHKATHKVTDPGRLQAIREHLGRIRPLKGTEGHARGLARRARRRKRRRGLG